jgi:shikimate dehydrogenase
VISAQTRLAGVIGDPVRHSLSPVLHNTAYEVLGLDWVYVAFEVPADATTDALDAARALDLVGLSVTMPHKTAAADACNRLSDTSRALRSVNTVTLVDGMLHGDSTDGPGFVRSVQETGHEPAGTRALVLGAGGAARAVARALADAGASVTVSARRADAAEAAASLAGPDTTTVPWAARDDAVADTDLLVNATPVGMDESASPIAAASLHRDLVVADLVYHPLETPLLAAARAAGAAPVDGLGMLVEQAGLQVERWTGRPAPIGPMRSAAEAALKLSGRR